jgi:hypothetical protein
MPNNYTHTTILYLLELDVRLAARFILVVKLLFNPCCSFVLRLFELIFVGVFICSAFFI